VRSPIINKFSPVLRIFIVPFLSWTNSRGQLNKFEVACKNINQKNKKGKNITKYPNMRSIDLVAVGGSKAS